MFERNTKTLLLKQIYVTKCNSLMSVTTVHDWSQKRYVFPCFLLRFDKRSQQSRLRADDCYCYSKSCDFSVPRPRSLGPAPAIPQSRARGPSDPRPQSLGPACTPSRGRYCTIWSFNKYIQMTRNSETIWALDEYLTHDLLYTSLAFYHRGTATLTRSQYLVMTHRLYHTVNWIILVCHVLTVWCS